MALWYVNQSISPGEETDTFIGQHGTGKLRDSWADVTWTTGDRYYQAGGLSVSQQIDVGGSGASGNPIYIGKYGHGLSNPVVGNGQQWGVRLAARQYVDVEDIDASKATDHGFYIRTSGSNITTINLRRCNAYLNENNGFFLDGVVLTAAMSNVVFEDCSSYDNAEHGFDTLGIIQNATWRRCVAYRNGYGVLGHGFSLHPFISNNITSGWTLVAGNVYSRTLSAGETVQKLANITAGVTLAKNAGAGSGVTTNQWDQSGTTLYVNTGGNPNSGTTIAWKRAAHGPFYYEDCVAWGNSTRAGPGEGHGFAADDMSGPAYYSNCISYDNEGAGFQCQWTDDVRHLSCIAARNALSNFRSTGHTDRWDVDHCLAAYGVQHGFFFDDPFSSVRIRNSIAVGNTLWGIIGAVVGVSAANNCLFGNGSGDLNNVTDTAAVLLDPRLLDPHRPWLGLRHDSPVLGRGTYIQGARDRYNRRFGPRPNIGPWARLSNG